MNHKTKIQIPNGVHLFMHNEGLVYAMKLDEDQYNTFTQIFPPLFTDASMTSSTDGGIELEEIIIGTILDEYLPTYKMEKDIQIGDYKVTDTFLVALVENGYIQPIKLSEDQHNSITNLIDLIFPSDEDGNTLIETFDEFIGSIDKRYLK